MGIVFGVAFVDEAYISHSLVFKLRVNNSLRDFIVLKKRTPKRFGVHEE